MRGARKQTLGLSGKLRWTSTLGQVDYVPAVTPTNTLPGKLRKRDPNGSGQTVAVKGTPFAEILKTRAG